MTRRNNAISHATQRETSLDPRRLEAKEAGLWLTPGRLREAMVLINEQQSGPSRRQIEDKLVRAISIAIERENRRVATITTRSVAHDLEAVQNSGVMDPHQPTQEEDVPPGVRIHGQHIRVERLLDYLAAAQVGLVPVLDKRKRNSRPVDSAWFSSLPDEDRKAFHKARVSLLTEQISREQVRELAQRALDNLPKRTRGGSNYAGRPFERELLEAIVEAWKSGRPHEDSGKREAALVSRPGVKKPQRESKSESTLSPEDQVGAAFTRFSLAVYAALGRAPGPEDQGFYDMVRRARLQHDFHQSPPEEIKKS